ncbi:AbrB/MazE/SpoVT family DNA-binding domain-containing protein [Candidatus Saccharibacteria bacterium]|nr:AbrB/MazE/SpoVT family DNA-binding domain-containing protein [Candidatus Saccharibacteria bacterium]
MVQKVIKIGDSLGVTIPKSTVQKNKIKIGDPVEVFAGREGRDIKVTIVLQKIKHTDYNKK